MSIPGAVLEANRRGVRRFSTILNSRVWRNSRTLSFVLVLPLAACGVQTATPPPTVSDSPASEETSAVPALSCDVRPDHPVTFLALGDSYTIGQSVEESERWPVQLAALLTESGIEVEPPVIIARTGWTTDELNAAIDEANPQGLYDVVSLLIGVNNQYRGYPIADFRSEFAALLDRAIGFAGGEANHVIVLSIPDWGVTPFGISSRREETSAEIDAYNAIKQEVSEAAGVHYVDITPISREAPNDPALTASDDLHPSGKMYTEWARLAFDAACAALSQ